ncbi:MAG TPA: S8 family peptidase [Myxococcota bacterium]|nr:S8 family peptidase [Myxococcota bacterium]
MLSYSTRWLAGALAAAFCAAAAHADIYIVRLADPPVADYEGGIAGLAPTKPQAGRGIDPLRSEVRQYVSYLAGKQNAVLQSAGGGARVYNYAYAFNGFAADMSAVVAEKLKSMPGVLAVTKDEKRKLDTSRTPDFLGLRTGLWQLLGGEKNAGEGIVVGILDSGVWPENPSFSDRDRRGRRVYSPLPSSDFHGICQPGVKWTAKDCNRKLIGARYYNAGFGGPEGVLEELPYEFISARDVDGHGSHTSSTAAGNADVVARAPDNSILGVISGMAPRARIAIYKVCWGISPEGGCFSSDSVAAIDQAVADGVDVLNFSISGTSTNFLDPVEVAFLFAADAGVFVAASAGNDGPGESTVAHPSPWLTTVAAGSHDRVYLATATTGDGADYEGAGLGDAVPSNPLVQSTAAGLAGADADDVRLCVPGTLDPAVVAGKIVLCDRGVIARVDKSTAVQLAGGIGMILANTSPSSLNADIHAVPSIHVDEIAGAAIKAYIALDPAAATAALSAGEVEIGVPAPFVAAFSSRGPLLATADLLKPDIMAPGVDVLAAYSPFNFGNFNYLSGTSMSSPHIAGIGALMKQLHPDWSPMAIKSALMTTASQSLNVGGAIPGTAFDYGAGQVDPNAAADPGLVYDSGFLDWIGFLCGTGQFASAACASLGIDPSDLNYASISVGELAGSQTVTRTVTNVGPAGTYDVSVEAPAGVDVMVSPTSLTLGTGDTGTYEVTLVSNASASVGDFVQGSLTWSDGVRSVRSPIVTRALALAVPAQVQSTGDPVSFPVTFGYTGAFGATARGLVEALEEAANVVDDPANDINTALTTGVGITVHVVTVPAGTTHARFSLFDDFTDGNDDLDLYVFDSTGSQVGGSGSGTSAEEVNLVNPAADDYFVVVHGWQTDGPDANYTLFSYLVDGTDAGNMTITAPAAAVLGMTANVDVSFSGLTAGRKYLGAVDFNDGTDVLESTLVRVDP